MGSNRRCWSAGYLILLLMSGCATLPKTSRDYGDVTRRMDIIAVMPTKFSLSEVGTFTSQQTSEVTRDIELEIQSAAQTVIEGSRYKRAAFDASDSALANDSELRTALFEDNQAMADVFRRISKTHSKEIDIEYAGNVDLLADRAHADYLLFIQGNGYFKTTGAQVKDAIIAGLLGGGAEPDAETGLSGVLVDARTKKVVWYNTVSRKGKDPRKPSHLLAVTQRLTQPLLGKIQVKADKDRDHDIIDKYKAAKKN